MDLMNIMYSCPGYAVCLCVGIVCDCGSEIIVCYEFIPGPVYV